MGVREIEAAILCELREVTGNGRIRQKDIQEWSTGEVKVVEDDDELLARLPLLNINVAYKLPPKRTRKKA